MGLVSGWSLANHSNSESFLVAHIAQRRWTLVRGILGRGRTHSVSFQPFPNSSGWWWLIRSIFLIRISCHKTTHANGYYGAWPGWAVSISMLPLTHSHLWKFTAWRFICKGLTEFSAYWMQKKGILLLSSSPLLPHCPHLSKGTLATGPNTSFKPKSCW